MEISVQDKNSLRIRGKHAGIFVNPQDAGGNYNMAILIGNPLKSTLKVREDVVVIDGPGEYEAGGIKVTGLRTESGTVYSIVLDNLQINLGDGKALEKAYQKLKESNLTVVFVDELGGGTDFLTSITMNSMLFFGPNARTLFDTFEKNEKKISQKFSISSDKLPVEMETVLLIASS